MNTSAGAATKMLQCFIYGGKEIPGKNTSPHLKPFDELPEDVKQYDIDAIQVLPLILRDLGLEFYRMQRDLEDPVLLDRLARADLTTGRQFAAFTAENPIQMCAISPDGECVVAVDLGGLLHRLQVESPTSSQR